MISLLCILVAAFFNACMDALENENFYESVFRNWYEKFWYKRVSWKYAKKIGGYKVDAWHLSKTAMVVSIALAVVFYRPWLPWWADVLIIGFIWNAGFNLFYHKIFKVK